MGAVGELRRFEQPDARTIRRGRAQKRRSIINVHGRFRVGRTRQRDDVRVGDSVANSPAIGIKILDYGLIGHS